ncbi:MAG: carboxylate--amine ligase [Geminicoccaceae bacterium]
MMRILLGKMGFQRLAERRGFPVPRGVRLTLNDDGGAAKLRYPCVVKPTTKDPRWAREFRKAYKVGEVAEVAMLWDRMCKIVSEVIVQEWIEGDDSDVYFCLQYRAPAGGPVTSFVGQKLRQWPPLVGGTASCVAAPEAAAELEDLTNRFFGSVGMVGLCSMEYKRDRRDGRFYMVEPTVGRTDFQEEIATLNGVNIPLAAYCGELGLPLPPLRRTRRAVGWRDPIGDSQAQAVSGTAVVKPGVALRNAYWRWYDPMPFVALQLERARGRWSRLRGRRRQALNAN